MRKRVVLVFDRFMAQLDPEYVSWLTDADKGMNQRTFRYALRFLPSIDPMQRDLTALHTPPVVRFRLVARSADFDYYEGELEYY